MVVTVYLRPFRLAVRSSDYRKLSGGSGLFLFRSAGLKFLMGGFRDQPDLRVRLEMWSEVYEHAQERRLRALRAILSLLVVELGVRQQFVRILRTVRLACHCRPFEFAGGGISQKARRQ